MRVDQYRIRHFAARYIYKPELNLLDIRSMNRHTYMQKMPQATIETNFALAESIHNKKEEAHQDTNVSKQRLCWLV